MSAVSGTVAPGYEPVAEAFAATLDGAAGGAAFAAVVDGEPVLDLWGGDFVEDTLVLVFSGTKGVVATALLLLLVPSSSLRCNARRKNSSRWWFRLSVISKAGSATSVSGMARCTAWPNTKAPLRCCRRPKPILMPALRLTRRLWKNGRSRFGAWPDARKVARACGVPGGAAPLDCSTRPRISRRMSLPPATLSY